MQSLPVDQEFLLVCESILEADDRPSGWRFVLERIDGTPYLEAEDREHGDNNRLSLWAVVRGLEALPGPAAVTMLTSSRYVIRSLTDSLPRWKAADFVWEQFGQRLPVTNADLWRRVDRVLDIHAVSACCVAAAPRVNRRVRLATPEGWGASGEILAEAHQRHERGNRISDSVRRWLFSQCRAVAVGCGGGSHPRVAVA